MTTSLKEFLPGMKVIARNDKKLGVGEIYAAINDQNPSYKVLFTNPPIKLLYPHELHRISIPNGTLVKTRYGIGRIIHIEEKEPDKLYRYNIEFFKKKVTKMLKEDAILKIIPGFKPDLLHPEFIAGHLAGYFLNAYNFRYCLPTDPQYQAICHGRIEAFPHQIGVINHVLSTYPSRFLLCDEVGLGKTIEACAILKELFLRNIIHRAIIVVPANLVPQWKFELESKFNLHFKIYDGKCLKELKNDFPELNPWTIHPRIITSLHFARRDENRELLKDVFFDMAIFDEAHHLRRYHSATGSHRRTKNYDLGETMSNNSRLALFLTATPLQLDPFELFSLIELLDPALFPKYSTFLDFKEKISHYNLVLANLNRFGKLNVFERNYMISTIMEILNGDDWDHSKESIQQSLYTRDPKLRKEIIQKIHDRHLLSKILIRNKKKHVFEGKLPKRKTRIILIEPTEEELKIYNDIRLYITKVYQRALEEGNSATGFVMVSFQKLLASSHFALRKTISKRITTLREHQIKLMQKRAHLEKNPLEIENEKEYKIKMKVLDDQIQVIDEDIPILHDYLERLESLKIDSKALALKDLLEKAREKEGKTKIIVFTQFIRTLLYLKSFLEKSFPDINVTVFHGKLSKDEKNIAVERFKSSNDNITVLISTEAGGEGRNFQFCHNMVNYDLPWNPMKLEQRIGRIDRIGQVYDVNIFNFALKGTVEERVCQLLSERIFTFQEIVGELEPILVDFNDDIEKAIFASNTELGELKFQVLEDKLSQTLQKIHDHRASMQDFIMEMKSKQVLKDDSLTCKLDFSYYDILKDFSLNLVKETRDGKDELISALHETYKYRNAFSFEELKKGIYSIKDDLVEEEYIGTFERKIALSNERLEFFNLGHPFIEKIIDSALNIDVSKKIGIVVTNPKELERSIPNAGASDNKAYFILANSIDKSGVISQKQLLFNVYSLGENGLSEISSVVNPKELLDYMVTCNDIINANFSDRIKDMHKNIVSLIKLNNQRTKTFLSGIEPEWKEANKIYHDKMVAKEKHYHGYQEKKLRDEILQFKFLLNEKKESKKEKDQKAVKTLEGKIKKVKDAISIVKVDHEKRLKEIQETFNRIDITWTLLSIILILPA